MNQPVPMTSEASVLAVSHKLRNVNWERLGVLYARLAVGSAFLSAVSSRFGLWSGSVDMKHFANFLEYAGEVLAFMPKVTVPYFAWTATICEAVLGVLLIVGLWPRWVSLGSAVLLAMFGTSMAISQGLKSPMDYSVYSASSAAVLLALHAFRRNSR
jgi:putative oxidoreductase